MLSRRVLLDAPDVRVAQVSCDGRDRGWSEAEEVARLGLVLVRTGVFRRRTDGSEAVLDSTMAYVQRPGEVQQVAHPAGGDVCTSMTIPPEVAERFQVAGPLRVTSEADLAHRWMVARAAQGADMVELADRAVEVVVAVLAKPAPRPRAHLVDDARIVLNARPALPLTELASELGVSPWHLSRVFHRVVGVTISRYRLRLRVRAALERLTGGRRGGVSDGLADLAAELGFADQAHFSRVVRAETGRTPSVLRTLLAGGR